MNHRIIVSAIIEHNGKYLFGRKPKDIGPYPNTWRLLGGGVSIQEETLLDAIRRENEIGEKIIVSYWINPLKS